MEARPRPVHGDRDRGPALLAMWWTELSVCIIMVSLRIYSRYKLKNFGLDDGFIITALVLFVATTVTQTVSCVGGGARHLYFLTPAEIEYNLKVIWIENPLGIMAGAVAKISVAFLILRLIGPKTFWRKWSLYLTIALVFIFGTLASIFTFAQCNPPRVLWEGPVKVPEAKCWNPKTQSDFATFAGSYYTFVDFFLALLPVTFLWNLNLDLRRKVALSILMSMGVFAGICSAVKTSYLHLLSARSDFTWMTYDLSAWTAAELFLLIICACIPTIKPIYDLVHENNRFSFSSYFSSKRHRSSYQKHSGSSSPHVHASADKTPGASTIVTSLPDAKKVGDPWKDEDRNQLIGLGDISVRREWDVQHGKTGLGAVTDPYKIDGSKEFRPGRFGGDDVV